jgi:hypothetical protein
VSKATVSGTGWSALKAAPMTMSSKAVHKPISTVEIDLVIYNRRAVL